MYKLLRPLLFQLDPETAHHLVLNLGGFFSVLKLNSLIKSIFSYEHESLKSRMFGIDFENPVGLAAGFDKDGMVPNFFSALGFGFIETGTVVPEPQSGNPKPRLFRRPNEKALVNRLGFNSKGMQNAAENLKKFAARNFVLGINIGKNKITPNENAAADYNKGFETLAPLADYVAVNISSPNTPGLRELQNKELLKNLLSSLPKTKPLLLKVAPDLSDNQLDDILSVAQETKISGLIATNTIAMPDGGLSGKPLRSRATEVIGHIYKKTNGQMPIIGVGGIFSAQDAYEKVRAGASLIQIYTGMIYEGPGLVKKIKKGLVELLKRDGFSNISEAVGADHR